MKIILNLFTLIYFYNVVISLFCFKRQNEPTNSFQSKNKTSFKVLIPCHNEEAVILDNLNSLKEVSYPYEYIEVVVIADNCSDKTVQVCNNFIKANKNFNCKVIEVFGGTKPKAINKAIKYLKTSNLWNSDNIFLLDADNKVNSNIFDVFNYYHLKNEKILQCRIKSANDSSYIAKGFTSSFNSMSYGFQLAKNNAKLSASLSGTGFSVNRTVFDSVGFDKCRTLTEDLEFSVLSILKGYKIKYINQTYVLNQNLDELIPSILQRSRWCKGHMQVCAKHIKTLFLSFLHKPSLQLLDTIIFVISPSKLLAYTIGGVCSLLLGTQSPIIMTLSVVAFFYNMILLLKCNNYNIKYIVPHILYAFTMYFIILHSVFSYKDTTWNKTIHKKIKTFN